MTTVLVGTLLANLVTLVVTVIAAIKRPILSYRLIAGVALCATLFALRQVVTGQGNLFALLFSGLLVVKMARRIALNVQRIRLGKAR
jgi:hypothetical protein